LEFSLPDGTRWRRELIDGALSEPTIVASPWATWLRPMAAS